ncbi:unnamed protein product [Diplocarpon coronariae]
MAQITSSQLAAPVFSPFPIVATPTCTDPSMTVVGTATTLSPEGTPVYICVNNTAGSATSSVSSVSLPHASSKSSPVASGPTATSSAGSATPTSTSAAGRKAAGSGLLLWSFAAWLGLSALLELGSL